MKLTRKFTLERPARKAGGDRYQEEVPTDKENKTFGEPMMGTTYVNQSTSRFSGIPANTLWITISTEAPSD